jgi:hypothetical protein
MITIAVLSTSAIFQLLVAWGSVLLSFITGTVIVGMLIYWVFVIVNHSIARVAAKDADLSRRVLVWVSFLLSLSGSCLFLAAAFTAFLATKSVEQCRDLNVPTPGITSFLSEFWNYQGWVMIVALVVGMCLFEIRSARTTRKVIINGVYVVASLIAATVVLVGLILPLPLLMGAS